MTFLFGRPVLMMALIALVAIPSAAAKLTVTWDDNSTGETGFRVERASDAVNFVEVGTVAADVVTFVDTTVVSGSTYSYRVAAYNATATSAYSNVTSATTAVLAVSPTFTTQPVASQTVTAGANVSLMVAVSGTPAPTLQWKKNGTALSGATGTTLTLSAVSSTDAATYTAVATNSAGTLTSNNAFVAVSTPVAPSEPAAPSTVAPLITTQPTSTQTVTAGTNVTLTVAASGSPTPTFQWKKDGVILSGATKASLKLNSITVLEAGIYSAVATNSAGSATSSSATVLVEMIASNPSTGPKTPATPPKSSAPDNQSPNGSGKTVTSETDNKTSSDLAAVVVDEPVSDKAGSTRLMNLSVRAVPGPGERALLVGFVVNGGTKSMLVRAIGPGLATYTNLAVFQDPKLTLHDGFKSIASNDNWAGVESLKSKFQRLGAFPLPDASKDAAVLSTFAAQSYTANVTGAGTGLAMAEVYDADETKEPAGRLVNLSARAHAGPGDGVLIVGFVISGDVPLQVLVRAVGPALSSQGVSSALSNPQLNVYRGDTLVKHNDDWAGTAELTAAFKQTGAFALRDPNSKDAALIVTLAPGAYTAIVSGVDGSDGIALAEVYEMR